MVCLIVFFIATTCLSGVFGTSSTHSVLGLAPCSSVNSSLRACISSNNCSGRGKYESCQLMISLPAEDTEVSTESIGKPTMAEVWSVGGFSVGVISLSGAVGAVMWPAINSPIYRQMMRLLIGLAVGSLTSTALFQLIPEAYQLKEKDANQTYLYTALFGWLSVWSLYLIEAISKIIFYSHSKDPGSVNVSDDRSEVTLPHVERNILLPDKHNKESKMVGCYEKKSDCSKRRQGGAIAGVAWIVILGDGLHNFIDGMTIGAGYTQSLSTGIGLSLGIAAEEFPHELGDFAILVQSGMPVMKALCYNFLSACTAFLGFVLGVLLGQIEGSHFIFSFAAGLFLYISLTHLIPELKDMLMADLRRSKKAGLCGLLLQNVGLLTGTVLVFFITKYNDDITALTA